jgi:pimeloyl-ACP methyl ester carboxylesterase
MRAHESGRSGERPPQRRVVPTPDGLNIDVQEWGSPGGAPVVLIHGGFQSHLSWRKQYRSELCRHFRMITYNLRGHGGSDKPLASHYYSESECWAQELDAVLSHTGGVVAGTCRLELWMSRHLGLPHHIRG